MDKKFKLDEVYEDLRNTNLKERQVCAAEIDCIDFDEEFEGSTEMFAIRPAIVIERSHQAIVVYGIYNRTTGIRETEVRQLHSAAQWADALTRAAKGEELPGLGGEAEG